MARRGVEYLQGMNLPPGEQEVALGAAQGFFRCGVEDDQQRLVSCGVFRLLQQRREAQAIDGCRIRGIGGGECPPQLMHHPCFKSQRLRGSRSVGGTDLAQQCLLVIGQGNGGFGQFVEQFAHFGGDAPQRSFVKPALVAQYLIEQCLPGTFGQGVGDAVQRGVCHVIFQRVETWQQQRALRRLQQCFAQGRRYRQRGGQYAQGRQVARGDSRCVQRQQLFGDGRKEGVTGREGLDGKAHEACEYNGVRGMGEATVFQVKRNLIAKGYCF